MPAATTKMVGQDELDPYSPRGAPRQFLDGRIAIIRLQLRLRDLQLWSTTTTTTTTTSFETMTRSMQKEIEPWAQGYISRAKI